MTRVKITNRLCAANLNSFNALVFRTVYEFVASGRFQQDRWFKKLDDNDKLHIERALKSVGMEEQRNKKIGDLSGGQKQRVGLARVFATRSRFIHFR